MKTFPSLFQKKFLFPGILSILLIPSFSFSGEFPDISLSVSFDIEKGVMSGRAVIVTGGEETLIRTGSLAIRSLKLNGLPVKPETGGAIRVKAEKQAVAEIEYECLSGDESPCIVDGRGIFLAGNWYPSVDGLKYHHLRALLPPGLTAVSESERTEVAERADGNLYSFTFPYPVEEIHLIAREFTVRKGSFRGTELFAYFFPEDEGLADEYLEYTKRYLELYEGMLGKFPFRRFSVVEHILPAGYSMPTFTLLGQDVVRLPFIVRTSLGHEIVHQWLGNLVYVDYEKGNWAEGLATYLSDHLYEEQEGRGWQYRKQILIDYKSYVVPAKEFPLKDFRSGTDFLSRAIGYGKSAMLFHMLRRLVGDESFSQGLRSFIDSYRFRKASWHDMALTFERESGEELGWFFDQWLREKGYARLDIKNTEIGPKGLQSVVSFDVIQKEKTYVLDLPVEVTTDKGKAVEVLKIEKEKQRFGIIADGDPEKLAVDEDYDTFRELTLRETPPVIGRLLGEEKGIVALQEKEEVFSALVEFLRARGYEVRKPEEIKDEEIRASSLVIAGSGSALERRLFGRNEPAPAGFSLMVRRNPLNPSKVVALAGASSKEEVEASWGKIPHYGKYGLVAFRGGKNTEKKIWESERGWIMPLKETTTGIETSRAVKIDEIIGRVNDKKVIYVGEQHDRYEHHVAQLEVIKGLFRKDPRLAIGMEMFQRPFQNALNDYIDGRTDEREFLKSSEYFRRWGFDYNLYKDILRFARDERIPVIALNIRKEIVDKVSKGGIDSLTTEEKKELPESMDMTDEDYRRRLLDVFERHEGTEGRDFSNFYQSQILWDETMAQSIDDYLKNNPERRMVVLAGGGHLAYGSGIPKRTFRRNGMSYAVILNDESVEPDIADFILYPKQVKMISAPKLMAFLRGEEGGVRVLGFPEKSVSQKAGLEKDDFIVAIDEEKVGSVEDIQLSLFFKKPGDIVKVTVLRKRFLFGPREMRFEVTL